MRCVEKGHHYFLDLLDGSSILSLVFVKRVGENYPGNKKPPYPGTNIQEVLRVLIDRTKYLNIQKQHWINPVCIFLYRLAIYLLEFRAAQRHKVPKVSILKLSHIELLPTCKECGHVNCEHRN